jgi:hypothetical protein
MKQLIVLAALLTLAAIAAPARGRVGDGEQAVGVVVSVQGRLGVLVGGRGAASARASTSRSTIGKGKTNVE